MKRLFGLVIAMLSLSVPGALAAERLEVNLGQSQVIGPVHEMSTVIVGDDGIVSATLGGGGTIILTGKNLGATNLIILDENGRELLASELHVLPLDRRPSTNIRIVKGVSGTQNYRCEPDLGCSPVDNAVASDVADANRSGDDTTPETEEPAELDQTSLNQQVE
jgi:hypothetical protein